VIVQGHADAVPSSGQYSNADARKKKRLQTDNRVNFKREMASLLLPDCPGAFTHRE
jgi:hypothetical protein